MIEVKQIRSVINRPFSQKRTIRALGLGKINKIVKFNKSPQVEGMIKKVKHLVRVRIV